MKRWLATRRPALLWRGIRAKRDQPDLDGLRAVGDPEAFMWAVLPHAARSFAASIVALPKAKARAAAVAYLYCRMLDTYEDLYPDIGRRVDRLLAFGSRLDEIPLRPPPPIPDDLAVDQRDRLHLLLVAKCDRVDAVYRSLPGPHRAAIQQLVSDMAEGMAWSAATLADQGGTLVDRDQLLRYCHEVIGHPALFALRVLDEREPDAVAASDALAVSEMIQLANVTRDIEKDLRRGVAYHADLAPFLNGRSASREAQEAARQVRQELLVVALTRAPAYVRLFDDRQVRRSPAARAAAVMMFGFTENHYADCLRAAGFDWMGPGKGPIGTVMRAAPALVSAKAARRTITSIESRFLGAAQRLESSHRARVTPGSDV